MRTIFVVAALVITVGCAQTPPGPVNFTTPAALQSESIPVENRELTQDDELITIRPGEAVTFATPRPPRCGQDAHSLEGMVGYYQKRHGLTTPAGFSIFDGGVGKVSSRRCGGLENTRIWGVKVDSTVPSGTQWVIRFPDFGATKTVIVDP